MTISICDFLKSHGFQVEQLISRYHPFPPEDDVSAKPGPRFFHLKMPSFSHVDNSWNFGRTFVEHHHHYHSTTASTINPNETRAQKEAREAKEKKEQEEKTNRNLMILGGVAAAVFGYIFGGQYQALSEPREKLEKLGEERLALNNYVSRSNEDHRAVSSVNDVCNAYLDFYEGKVTKLKTKMVFTGMLLVEAVALAVAAFYKSYRIRDGIIVAGFLTGIAALVSYAIFRGSDSQKAWEQKHLNLNDTIARIKQAIQESLLRPQSEAFNPPSYAQATAGQREYTDPIEEDGYKWTQHIGTRTWLFWDISQNQWLPGNRYWNTQRYPIGMPLPN